MQISNFNLKNVRKKGKKKENKVTQQYFNNIFILCFVDNNLFLFHMNIWQRDKYCNFSYCNFRRL